MCADNRDLRECPHGGTCRLLTRENARRATRGASGFLVLCGVLFFFAHLTGIMQGIFDVIVGLGVLAMLTVGVVIGLAVIRVRAGFRAFRGSLPQQPQVPYERQQQVYQPRQQSLPAAEVHHHHGHNLVLPGVTGEDLAKLLNRDGQ